MPAGPAQLALHFVYQVADKSSGTCHCMLSCCVISFPTVAKTRIHAHHNTTCYLLAQLLPGIGIHSMPVKPVNLTNTSLLTCLMLSMGFTWHVVLPALLSAGERRSIRSGKLIMRWPHTGSPCKGHHAAVPVMCM